ncbi:holo-ACP synthase [Glaciecola siphonariae]|uniref:Holo-[acyl-carrier-protein] synthase n=1 Tax=Glaciecola siphonariae TaxID=521012 RepID=A0ABV9LZL0_9ALTE
MMILGIGTDIVDIKRIEKALSKGDALAKRVLTEFEWQEFTDCSMQARYLAKKFASKEAAVKAIGTGIGHGISWQHIEVIHDELGKPILRALGAFELWCREHQVSSLHISIADEQDYATAFVIIEAQLNQSTSGTF